MAIVVDNPFKMNDKKMRLVKDMIWLLFQFFPNHQTGGSCQRAGTFTYFRGEIIAVGHKAINEIHFSILTPKPLDNRKTIFGYPIGEAPLPRVVGAFHIYFKEKQVFATKIDIEVFGLEHETVFTEFAKDFENRFYGQVGNINVKIESRSPLDL